MIRFFQETRLLVRKRGAHADLSPNANFAAADSTEERAARRNRKG